MTEGRDDEREQAAGARQQAQLAAEQSRARQARQRAISAAGGVVVVAATVLGLALTQDDGDTGAAGPSTTGLLTGPPPWPARGAGLQERVAALRFPPVGDESYHAHVLLSVYRDRTQVVVPPDLGYDLSDAHSSLHAHDSSGVIHMEADDPYPYRLSHVMTTWGVAFGPDRLRRHPLTREPSRGGSVPRVVPRPSLRISVLRRQPGRAAAACGAGAARWPRR